MPTEAFPRLPIRVGVKVLSGFAFRSQDFSSTGIPVVKIKNIQNRQVHLDSDSYILPEAVTEKMEKFYLKDRDILIAMTGQGSVGRVGQLRLPSKQKVLLNQRVGKFYVDESKINAGYLYQILSTEYYERILFDAGSGSGQPNLSPSQIESLEIPLPPLPEQRAIAHILGTLDDKIELNRKMNETLEAMARALFKSWFVDFDPVRRNMARRGLDTPRSSSDPKGRIETPGHSATADEIDALFPSEFEFVKGPSGTELVEVPKGWRVGKLGETIDFVVDNRGKTPPTIEKTSFSYPMAEVNSLSENQMCLNLALCKKHVTAETYKSWFRKGHPRRGDVLVSTVGSIGNVALMFDEQICIAQNLIALRSSYSGIFLYEQLRWLKPKLLSLDISSVQPSIKVPHLLGMQVVIPNINVARAFESTVAKSFNKAYLNNAEMGTLSILRDTLLPKLISGELRVPLALREAAGMDAERFVGV